MRGISLLEVIIVLIIFTVGVIAVVGIFGIGLAGSIDSENTIISMNLAQKRMEEIRNLDFDTGIINEAKAAVAGFAGFQRQVEVEAPQAGLKQITVTVFWSYKGAESEVPLLSYISKN
ncbi:MAG: hypothetical protein COV72_04630 [Candidatus Omnitrophica bacterium CG11_big_fil_rev_8_21_14_0_20_42_13]|uniref:Prepilin-type N-terminal cleavage/methylation domain-containing protein n=1 Tax=Candidatus Ghiorseimicrobium undicola TaxID=1974746 RepID=A0A2H0LXD3_9BACT|nr:MAG: hypothetical protein COV72_04630 [Candidatus Omnitrophica bacterium CG11_big_fil_rev_8_21_14_0_20_42_13]